MKKSIKILLGILVVLIIGVGIYASILFYNKKKIEDEKNLVLNNTNNLIKEVKKVCENQKKLETEEENIYKFIINDGKSDYKFDKNVTLPNSGILEINDECEVSLSLVFGEYNVLKNYKQEPKLETVIYKNGEVIYYNPELGELCNDYAEENSLNGVVSGCLKWYTFNDAKDKTIVSLILDHNIASSVRWLSETDYKSSNTTEEKYNNSLGPITLNNRLKSDINWKNEARLPKLDEMLKLINVTYTKFQESGEIFFDSEDSSPLKKCYKGDTSKCNFSWLYDRTSMMCKDYGCYNNSDKETYGYWLEDYSDTDNLRAYRIYQDGRITSSKINDLSTGLRVVIDVQKSLLK